jgi:hypothetical protein
MKLKSGLLKRTVQCQVSSDHFNNRKFHMADSKFCFKVKAISALNRLTGSTLNLLYLNSEKTKTTSRV